MKKCLYIGSWWHKSRTASNHFFLDLISEQYEITEFYGNSNELQKFENLYFDIVVIWQRWFNIDDISKYVIYGNMTFIPMYDDNKDLNSARWQEYKYCNIINFSMALHEKCLKAGFQSFYIQYFPKPKNNFDWGN